VVPAEPKEWTYDPFAAEGRDGAIWGRGAVDMLDMDAMTLAVVRDRMRTGRKPPRDVVLAFVADEEAGGVFGAQWLVQNQPALFDGCTEAISEVGGFSLSVNDDLRLYMIETAQKGLAWMRLTATGSAGHGSMVHGDNAVTRLCEAVARLGDVRVPVHVTRPVRAFLDEVGDAFGLELDPTTCRRPSPSSARSPDRRRRRCGTPPTRPMLDAGYKHNVIPGRASAMVDGRYLPGYADEWERELDEVLGPTCARVRPLRHRARRPSSRGARRRHGRGPQGGGPRARAPCRTCSRAARRQELQPLGHALLRLLAAAAAADLDFSGMFHGVDERVPLDSLQFGVGCWTIPGPGLSPTRLDDRRGRRLQERQASWMTVAGRPGDRGPAPAAACSCRP
jgi:acetylornithine deacetylase/succinyl-diaminopimelate desuccinylase-like protein